MVVGVGVEEEVLGGPTRGEGLLTSFSARRFAASLSSASFFSCLARRFSSFLRSSSRFFARAASRSAS